MSQFARVSVNISQVSGLFDYLVPLEVREKINIGSLVIVPFGNQRVQGIVLSFPEEPSVQEVKSIEAILEDEPVFTPNQIKLSEWMSQENLSSQSGYRASPGQLAGESPSIGKEWNNPDPAGSAAAFRQTQDHPNCPVPQKCGFEY
jgi:primosomal protein N'